MLAPALLLADIVQGYVLHPASGTRVSGVEVAFYLVSGRQLDEVLRQTTDARGRFEFSGPFLSAGRPFALAAFYQQIPHFSSIFEVGAQQEIILEVYDPTEDDRQLRIPFYSLFLSLNGRRLDVAHWVQIVNLEEKTYIGSKREEPRWVTEFILPKGLFALQSHIGRLIQASDVVFYDTQPLQPGITQIAFTFVLEAQRLNRGYVHLSNYPIEQLDIFLQPTTFSPGAPFEDLGLVDLHGSQYRQLRLTDLERGRRVVIPLPLKSSPRWLLKWLALSAAFAAGIAALVLGYRPAVARDFSQSPSDLRSLIQRRRVLLEEVARLDDEYANRPSDPRYQTKRTRLMEQALVLSRLVEEQDGDF